MVWLVFPQKQLIEVYRPDADVVILTADDMLEGGDVLPGFTLPVKDIFEE
jgi:Uma2 family endonuclease